MNKFKLTFINSLGIAVVIIGFLFFLPAMLVILLGGTIVFYIATGFNYLFQDKCPICGSSKVMDQPGYNHLTCKECGHVCGVVRGTQ